MDDLMQLHELAPTPQPQLSPASAGCPFSALPPLAVRRFALAPQVKHAWLSFFLRQSFKHA
jgi:hypothetical protein